MSDLRSPLLDLPLLTDQQFGAEGRNNVAVRMVEQIAAQRIVSRTLTTPPVSPDDADAYVVAPGATGAWSAKDNHLAYMIDGAWYFSPPHEGMSMYNKGENATVRYDGSVWHAVDGIQTLNDQTITTWDLDLAPTALWFLGGNRTLQLGGSLRAGMHYELIITQTATAPDTVTWPVGIYWQNNIAPTLSTNNGYVDAFLFLWDGSRFLEVRRRMQLRNF